MRTTPTELIENDDPAHKRNLVAFSIGPTLVKVLMTLLVDVAH